MARRDPVSDDHRMATAQRPRAAQDASLDHRMRPVVLDTGAIAAGSWSILTATQGGTPASRPSPLWYPTPPPADGADGHDPAGPAPAPPASSPVSAPSASPSATA